LSHDTGRGGGRLPATGHNWAFLSSGTWSLMGVELPEPIINDAARELNFTKTNRLWQFRAAASKHQRAVGRAGMPALLAEKELDLD